MMKWVGRVVLGFLLDASTSLVSGELLSRLQKFNNNKLKHNLC